MRLYAYFRSSASYRVRIVLHHKAVPFELVPVSLAEGARSEAHKRRNPLGQVPVLELEHAGKPVFLGQSLAIIAYLDEQYPERPLLPQDPIARARARELAELVNAGIQPLQSNALARYLQEELKADAAPIARRAIRTGLEALAARAAETAGQYMVGDAPSIADVCLVPQLYNARLHGVALDGLERLLEIDARCASLPGWARAHPSAQPDAA